MSLPTHIRQNIKLFSQTKKKNTHNMNLKVVPKISRINVVFSSLIELCEDNCNDTSNIDLVYFKKIYFEENCNKKREK